MPETPKDPPRNFPAGASPSPDWQRCLFLSIHVRPSFKSRIPGCQPGDAGASPAGRTISHLLIYHTAGVSLRSGVSKTLRVRGSTGTPCQFPHNSGVAKWQGSGFIRRVSPVRSRPPQLFSRAARSFSRSSALQAEEHGAKPWRSNISKTKQGLLAA